MYLDCIDSYSKSAQPCHLHLHAKFILGCMAPRVLGNNGFTFFYKQIKGGGGVSNPKPINFRFSYIPRLYTKLHKLKSV